MPTGGPGADFPRQGLLTADSTRTIRTTQRQARDAGIVVALTSSRGGYDDDTDLQPGHDLHARTDRGGVHRRRGGRVRGDPVPGVPGAAQPEAPSGQRRDRRAPHRSPVGSGLRRGAMTALAGMLQDEILRYAYVYGD